MQSWILQKKRLWATLAGVCVMAGAMLAIVTLLSLSPTEGALQRGQGQGKNLRVLDRNGVALAVSYQNDWNVYDTIPLHRVPDFLQKAFVLSEDKRFYEHNGVDWRARFHALWQNIRAMQAVRGASTLTEQVVRIGHPRPRTVWSRWLEGWEAQDLERHASKADILEYYLNQVPYASNRRGLVQAARHYFNRDLDTLNQKEMLALVALVRAPSRLDLYRDTGRVEASIHRLAQRLVENGTLSKFEYENILDYQLKLEKPKPPAQAAHFAQQALTRMAPDTPHHKIRTTLDADLQNAVQALLDRRLQDLKSRRVRNGAALVVDHHTHETLAWTVAGQMDKDAPGSFIDAVTAPRQPGSSMKPFLYALALENGWTAATRIDDSPLAVSVGHGLHNYRNYSRAFYGPVSLRKALGNSLNIPAVKTAQFVGSESYLKFLRALGFTSLTRHPDFYGDGLALGNGEVTLYEMVQAYAALANRGTFAPLKILMDDTPAAPSRQVLSPESASLIAHILSDPEARRLEFGGGSVLNLPVQTAVKTGTSTDYRDAWAIGFNDRYVVGVWMGNLDQLPMDNVTGSTGPGLLLRGVFAELNRHRETHSLYLSPRLVKQDVCAPSPEGQACQPYSEWFAPGAAPEPAEQNKITPASHKLQWAQPTPGLQLAMDPRIPDDYEAFEFVIEGADETTQVEWVLNGKRIAKTRGGRYLWPVAKGKHLLKAKVYKTENTRPKTLQVTFSVK